MTWRDHTWEFTVSSLSWIIAIGALVCVVAFLAYDAARQKARR